MKTIHEIIDGNKRYPVNSIYLYTIGNAINLEKSDDIIAGNEYTVYISFDVALKKEKDWKLFIHYNDDEECFNFDPRKKNKIRIKHTRSPVILLGLRNDNITTNFVTLRINKSIVSVDEMLTMKIKNKYEESK